MTLVDGSSHTIFKRCINSYTCGAFMNDEHTSVIMIFYQQNMLDYHKQLRPYDAEMTRKNNDEKC